MCLCLGQGSFGWHLTIVVSVFLPARTSTQCFPFHTGVKISVTTVTTVKPRVAALCIAVDPPTWLAAFIRWAKGAARRYPNAPVIGASSGGADSYCEGTSLMRRADDGIRTHDLLHRKRVAGLAPIRGQRAWLSGSQPLRHFAHR